jgi:hypothetical protein
MDYQDWASRGDHFQPGGTSMTARISKVDLQAMLRDPAAAFRSPRDVLDHPGLTHDERLAILQQWEHDAKELSVAEGEGMGGGEESMLSRVRLAIARLGEQASASAGSIGKHG